MAILTRELEQLRHENPDVATMMDIIEEIEDFYQEKLKWSGDVQTPVIEVTNSADMNVIFDRGSLTSN